MKLPVPSPSRMESVRCTRTETPHEFATTRSSLPSPLKSPTATEWGLMPTAGDEARVKLPVPSPSRMYTVPGELR